MSDESTEKYITLKIGESDLVFETNLPSVMEVVFWLRKFEQRILSSVDEVTE